MSRPNHSIKLLLLIATIVLIVCSLGSSVMGRLQEVKSFKIAVQKEHALFMIDLVKPGKLHLVVSPTGEEVSIVSKQTSSRLHHQITIPYLESSTEYFYSIIEKEPSGEKTILKTGSFHTPVILDK